MSVDGICYNKYLYNNILLNTKNKHYNNTIYQNNNISFGSNQEKSPKRNTKTIIGLISGLGAITVGVLLFKKWNPKPVKELAEHIDFVKADKIEDAVKFAKDNLGVKLNVGGQLKTANWINEALVNLSNKTKGKVLLPKEIKIHKFWYEKLNGRYNPFTRTVQLSKNYFGEAFEKDFEKVKRLGYLDNRLLTLYHEIGHGIHLTVSNIFNELFGSSKFKKIISPVKDDLTNYLGGKYYTKCEGETFAHIFGKKMRGEKLPEYVEKIWERIGGKY